LSVYNYKKSDTLTGNFKLLQLNKTPPAFPEGATEDPGTNAQLTCNDEFEAGLKALAFRLEGGAEAGIPEAIALAAAFNEKVKPKLVALLDMIVSIRQRGRLNDYIDAHSDDIGHLKSDLAAIRKRMGEGDANEVRINLATNYIFAFDAMARPLITRDMAKEPAVFLPAGSVNIGATDKGKAVLDAAARYDAALDTVDLKAIDALIKALDEIRKIPSQPSTLFAGQSLESLAAFQAAWDDLEKALDDKDVRKAFDDAF